MEKDDVVKIRSKESETWIKSKPKEKRLNGMITL